MFRLKEEIVRISNPAGEIGLTRGEGEWRRERQF
jgi:hypothetical protein